MLYNGLMNLVGWVKAMPLVIWLVGVMVLVYWLFYEHIDIAQWRLRYLRKRIYRAIQRGRLSELKRIVKNEPQLIHEPFDELNLTPLEAASHYGQALIVYWLRENGARSHTSGATQENAIYAVYRRKMPAPLKRAMLDAVCWKASAAELGQALCLGAQAGNVTVVVDLLLRGADVNTPNNVLGLGLERTPLMLALAYHHETVARILIANGAVPYWFDGVVERPLVVGGDLANLIHALQERGWKSSYWKEGRNPLVFALNLRDMELVRYLIDFGALPWLPLARGATPWLVAKALRNPIILDLLRGSAYQPLSLQVTRRPSALLSQPKMDPDTGGSFTGPQ